MKSCSEQLFDMAKFAQSSTDGCMLVSADRLMKLAQDIQLMERELDKIPMSPIHSGNHIGWGKGKDE